MKPDTSFARQAQQAAEAIATAFELYQRAFLRLTRCAQGRFEARDWHGHERDAVERLELYKRVIDRIVAETRRTLDTRVYEKTIWSHMRSVYSRLIAGRDDVELAETFFNSVTRRIFATIGVDPGIEFVDSDFSVAPGTGDRVYVTYPYTGDLVGLIRQLLCDTPFHIPFEDLGRDAGLIAKAIGDHLTARRGHPRFEALEVIKSPFFRNKGAYLVGRIRANGAINPLVIPLLNGPSGIYADTALLTEDEASIVFSFTHSYFHVETDCPYRLVDFLKGIMPWKRRAELYTAIGYNKHGKTELYRDLYCHLQSTDDRFQPAPGEKGMVMTVFTMPSFDVVFKVIRDNFPFPKRTTRSDVLSRYQLVFKRDRAGRLIDAQEFEHLAFDRARFSDEALQELLTTCSNTVSLLGDTVDIKHLYTERRITPLNLYLRQAGPEAAVAAVLDYGQAIKDLAATNIFPGDLFIKNFGVTRHGRVVFYDYDELCLLTDCNFRRIPPGRHGDDDLGDPQPWFSVAEHDVFPEEFPSFLGLEPRLRDAFIAAHSDLFDPGWWRQMQARLRAGEVMDLFPYPQHKRVRCCMPV
ncbi:MAG: bifunctional isocitrate dehydrogenase kinase/phosphatase [Anaerolineae bacterium]|nr:bifunctional isocitrate dehydrogenase kinase/phosphatase [Anaerolineae bacterium]